MWWCWPWQWTWDEKKKEPKTINVFLGFFFFVNLCLGTGFLGIPYAFFYTGYLAAIPTLLFISIVALVNANYLLEVMARAQALEYLKKSENPGTGSDITDTESEKEQDVNKTAPSILNKPSSLSTHPRFEITVKRKFEVLELCDIFLNRYMKYVYLGSLSIYSFLACWSYGTVAGSAWASNIPFNFGSVDKCEEDAFVHRVLPSGGCLSAYYLSLSVFGVIVITLSLLDLKEQAIVQLVMGFLRFATVATVIIYCLVRVIGGGDACEEDLDINVADLNLTSPVNVRLKSVVVNFDAKGWVVGIPVYTFALLFHTGIAALTHPIREKNRLVPLVFSMFVVSTVCYLSLGVVVPLWFRASIQETCTLNWGIYTHSDYSIPTRILAYYLILFPSFDVISAYPLVTTVAVNNVYILITGHDTSIKPKYKYDWFLRVLLRFLLALFPILAAFGVANLIYVLKYAGLVGFMCFFFPSMLQLRSIDICKKKFSRFHVSVSGSHSLPEKETLEEKELKNKGDISPKLEEEESLLAKEEHNEDEKALYMTPYSFSGLSHPLLVWATLICGIILFLLALVSLFVHPDKLSCKVLLQEMVNLVI